MEEEKVGGKKRGEGEGKGGGKKGEVLVRMCLDCGGSWRKFLEGHVSYAHKSLKIVSKPFVEGGKGPSKEVDLVRFFFFFFFFFFSSFLSLFSPFLLLSSSFPISILAFQKIPPRRNLKTND